ncbi:putative+ABC+transporter+permease+protein [Methylocapsa aurea]|jgi:iron complex transport system permease protein|uniref:FecCD family ABC transporter permease n=1 Tax=Methylocapsa aurea TaxID=663610 RepID=UPI003D18D8C5
MRLALLPFLLLAVVLVALSVGRYPLAPSDILGFLGACLGLVDLPPERFDLLRNLIVEIRLPRVLAAGLIGASLSASGASFQAVFRNPLVSPGILGVLGGAGFGAALGILYSGDFLTIQISAFAMGLVAVGVGVLIANLFGAASMVTLVLGGMISGALFASALSLVKYAADPYDQLPAIVYWMMGSLGAVDLKQLKGAAPAILIGVGALTLAGRALDALSMGDDEARSLGVPVHATRYGVIATATLVSSLSVSLAGMIGWVGLVVPHVARLAIGPTNSKLLPASALLGASFLIAADSVARNITRAEIPIGVVTELLGIPVFVLVLGRARRAWA